MTLWLRQLQPAAFQEACDRAVPHLELLNHALVSSELPRFALLLRKVDKRLEVELLGESNEWVITYNTQAAVPVAQWLAAKLQSTRPLHVGRPARGPAAGLFSAAAAGVDLKTARVRVGFARGHLLDIYVFVPLDVAGTNEQLQVAAELYLESVLGDEVLDLWVGQVAVDRMARARGLVVVSGGRDVADSYPLHEVGQLVERGISALSAELPSNLLAASTTNSDWAALTLERTQEDEGVLQPDRVFASTRFPEALKSCLSGHPFSSVRFAKGGEILIWARWTSLGGSTRLALRERVEESLTESTLAEPYFLLAGTGFGRLHDYVDLWIRPDAQYIATLGRLLAELTGAVTLGFYDARWSEQLLSFQANG